MRLRRLRAGALLTLAWGCSGSLPGGSSDLLGIGSCDETPYGSVKWRIGGFYHPDRLVDPTAVPLVAKVHVGERVELWINVMGHYCGSGNPAAEWISTAPQVVAVEGRGDFATLVGVSEGLAVVFATKYGAPADLSYYCCPPCSSAEPPPSCQYIPISGIRVVP